MSDTTLFDENFTIDSIDAGKYSRVSRIYCTSTGNDVSLMLDVNTELYPCITGDQLSLCLVSTVALDGGKDDAKSWRNIGRGESTLADHYDYVCRGKIYRFDEGEGGDIKVFVSFGGLLLYMQGPYKKLTTLRIDSLYLMMRKT